MKWPVWHETELLDFPLMSMLGLREGNNIAIKKPALNFISIVYKGSPFSSHNCRYQQKQQQRRFINLFVVKMYYTTRSIYSFSWKIFSWWFIFLILISHLIVGYFYFPGRTKSKLCSISNSREFLLWWVISY